MEAMTRRRVQLLLVLAMLGCFVGVAWFARRHRVVTVWRFQEAHKGMSREEVIHAVGGPPGHYARGIVFVTPRRWEQKNHESWLCDDGELLVRFDDSGMATDVTVAPVLGLQPLTLTERIRRWLGL
jgi:hypothetical protein